MSTTWRHKDFYLELIKFHRHLDSFRSQGVDGWGKLGMWGDLKKELGQNDDICHHMAYLRVHSRASSLYRSRSVLYILAISGTKGSSGFGSHNKEQIDRSTKLKQNNREISVTQFVLFWCVSTSLEYSRIPFEMVSAGDHWDLNISKQILPLLFIFGW